MGDQYRVKEVYEKYRLLQDKFENYQKSFAGQASMSPLSLVFDAGRLLDDKSWTLKIFVSGPALITRLGSRDFSGTEMQCTLGEFYMNGFWKMEFNLSAESLEEICNLCTNSLWSANEVLDRVYGEAFDSLSPELRAVCGKFLEALKDHRRYSQSQIQQGKESYQERCALEGKLREAKRRADVTRDALRGLQRIIEQEARNLYNTRTFLAGSKTIQGIREGLMAAISREALGEDSIYSDHEPPADLMPRPKTR